jgi:cell division protein FtsW
LIKKRGRDAHATASETLAIRSMAKKLRMDWWLFAVSVALALFGVMMVYSASAMIAMRETSNEFSYFNKQLIFASVGIALMLAISRIHYKRLENEWLIIGCLTGTLILLAAVFIFPPTNGARRWIKLAGFTFQPSEVAKPVLSLFLAYFLTRNEKTVGQFKQTILPCLMVLGILSAMILVEPDLGTVIVMAAIFTVVYFAAGARLIHIAGVGAAIVVVFAGAMIAQPYRMARLWAYLDPWPVANGVGYQVTQSLMAVGSGGIFGEGFARGQQKLFYLPFPYSDFIFAVVAEEFGLVGALLVVLAFGVLLWRGTRAALMAPDRFGKLLGIGLITGIIVQAFFNISVVLGILPTKGIPLPFISYGGSSILMTLISVGILLNISQHAGFVELENQDDSPETAPRNNRRKMARARTREA